MANADWKNQIYKGPCWYPRETFTCRLCKTTFDIPEKLGRHLIDEHQLSNFMAQSEVAVLICYWKAKRIEETYEGYWIGDGFVITGKKK